MVNHEFYLTISTRKIWSFANTADFRNHDNTPTQEVLALQKFVRKEFQLFHSHPTALISIQWAFYFP
jgi:hypothetical protein